MIIVEGPDGAGKTTLVEHLENLFGEREPRAVTAGAEKMKPIGQYIDEELTKGFGWRLYDRFALISSPMYMCLPNRTFSEEMLDYQWLKDAYYKFRQIDPVIIMCLPPLDIVLANVAKDESSSVMHEFGEQIYWNYHAFAARDGYNSSMMIYDYTNPNKQRLEALLKWAQARVAKGHDGRPLRSHAADAAPAASVEDEGRGSTIT